ncbi:MAG TPA: hypothetical protein VKE94_06135 [Gemmataceae bacterium]|nr:hypothetical protein [Gemmataceae bacterium]
MPKFMSSRTMPAGSLTREQVDQERGEVERRLNNRRLRDISPLGALIKNPFDLASGFFLQGVPL